MGFWNVVGKIGKGVGFVVTGLVSIAIETNNSANQHREKYNNSNMDKDEMINKFKKSNDFKEKMGIAASMQDKGYRD